MGARFSLWWQQIKQYRFAIGVVAIVLVVVIAFIIIGYWFDWTGFNGYNKVTIVHTINGTNAGTVTKTEEYQPGKGLWDWLQLLGVLAVPVVVGFGAVWFTTRQGRVADEENKDNQRETALQAYIDKMSELLLEKKLRDSAEEDEVRNIARVRTITILFQLDARRTGYVFAFLRESGLMSTKPNVNIVSLKDADLRNINFSQADLMGADLSEADLNGANLSGAYLDGADLMGAHLGRANFYNAILSRANFKGAFGITIEKLEKQAKSLEGATMPDGSIHP